MAVQLIVGVEVICLISTSNLKAEAYNVTTKTIPAPYLKICHNLPQPPIPYTSFPLGEKI